MPLRPGRTYRNHSGPAFTRIEYMNVNPRTKIVKLEMGNPSGQYEYQVKLVAQEKLQIRHNALEAARMAANRYLTKKVGKENFHLQIRAYPHHIIRENPILNTTHADRWQEGMRRAFGKNIGRAARVEPGKVILVAKVRSDGILDAKEALRRAASKLPKSYSIVIEKLNGPK